MKSTARNIFLGLFVIGLIFITDSCRKNFEFEEINKLTDDIFIDGEFAIPVVNTELTLSDFIFSTDSSLWIEIDDNDLIHLRMYYDNLVVFRMDQIYTNIAPLTYPIDPPALIPPQTHTVATDTSKMKVYNNILSGKLFFDNPSITFFIENEIPVVTFFKMDTLTFYNYDTLALSHTDHNEYLIPSPDAINTHADTSIIIDTTAIPELAQVFSPVPRFISFFLSSGSHDNQDLPYSVTGAEEMKIDVDIDLPLDARLDTIVMTDTSNFKVDQGIYEEVKALTLKIKINNGFPIDAFSQIYFCDSTDQGGVGNIVDSVFNDLSSDNITVDGWHLNPAETDAQGIVTFPYESQIIIYIDQERYQHLQDSHVSKMVIRGKLNSYNSHTGLFIKMLGKYKMGVKIAAKAEIEGNLLNF